MDATEDAIEDGLACTQDHAPKATGTLANGLGQPAPHGMEVVEGGDDMDCPHVVLLGDSTLDNGRYLNHALGELSVEKQLSKRCAERGWEMTALAQDGSMLEDVLVRQLPLIPEGATHIVLSASGNDLLSLLNQMVMAQFTMRSMYDAIGNGLMQVAERIRDLIQALKGLGCHLACCTVYRPNFNHFFFKSLAMLALGMHNSRIQQIAADMDCSVIDLANMFDHQQDFANPLELSTRGGSKVVENIAAFVAEHTVLSMRRFRHIGEHSTEDDDFLPGAGMLGISMRCCATRVSRRRVYASTTVPKALEQPDQSLAGGMLPRPLEFSEAQQRWRET
mmetsp:Transcript_67360/g.208397  ORF Transcript_67360/g.208397 Transcript_67360/m.208397 type:complete len:335 (-) Transcript_67360:482-1486(-)